MRVEINQASMCPGWYVVDKDGMDENAHYAYLMRDGNWSTNVEWSIYSDWPGYFPTREEAQGAYEESLKRKEITWLAVGAVEALKQGGLEELKKFLSENI